MGTIEDIGWYSYNPDNGVITYHEEFMPNEEDNRTWFYVTEINNKE